MYTLLAVGWTSLALISKFISKAVFLPFSAASGLSLLETTTYMVMLGFSTTTTISRRLLATSMTSSGTVCVILALALNYLLNIVHICIYCKYISKDK